MQTGDGAEFRTYAEGGRDKLAIHSNFGAGHLLGGYDGEEPQN